MEFVRESYHINNNMINIKIYLNKVLELLKRYKKVIENDFDVELYKKIKLIDQNLLRELDEVLMMIDSEHIIASEYRIRVWHDEYMKQYDSSRYFLDSATRKIS